MTAESVTAVGLLALGVTYARGLAVLWPGPGGRRAVTPGRVGLFAVAVGAVALALLPPLEPLTGRLLWLHMVQHLLLVLVAAPLLALARPGLVLAAGLGGGRTGAGSWRAPLWLRQAAHRPGWPLAAAAVHLVVLWGWHVPALYEAAVRSTAVHVAEHATMLGSAVWLWSALVARGGPVRRPRATGAMSIFAVATLSVGLGALLTFSPLPWYAGVYTGAHGLSPLQDQQVAGALMWSVGGITYAAAGAALFAAWLHKGAARV